MKPTSVSRRYFRDGGVSCWYHSSNISCNIRLCILQTHISGSDLTNVEAFSPYEPTLPVVISRKEYDGLMRSYCRILAIENIESAYDVFTTSAIELERFQLNAALECAYNHDTINWDILRHDLNIRVTSVLTSAATYVERLKRERRSLTNSESAQEAISQLPSVIFDTSFEYRLGCSLRTFAPHEQLPVSGLMFKTIVVENHSEDFGRLVRHTFDPYIASQQLIDAEKIPNRLKNELKTLDTNNFDLKTVFRVFYEAVAEMNYKFHEILKAQIHSDVERLENLLRSIPSRDAQAKGEICFKPNTTAFSRLGEVSIPIAMEMRDRFNSFPKLYSASRAYISSEITLSRRDVT